MVSEGKKKKRKSGKSTCLLPCLWMLFVLTGTGSEDLTALCVVNDDGGGRALPLDTVQTCTLGKRLQDLSRGTKKVPTVAHERDKQHYQYNSFLSTADFSFGGSIMTEVSFKVEYEACRMEGKRITNSKNDAVHN